MDSFNDANGAGFYTTTDSGEFYGYLIKTSVPGWVEVEVSETPPCGWGLGGWPDCVGDSQTGLGGVAGSTQHHYNPLMNRGPPYISPESMPLVTSCGAQTQCSNYPFSPEVHQSTEGWDAQSSPFGAVDWEGYLANAVESGVSAVAPVPNNHLFGRWGADQNGPSGFYTSVQDSYQPSISPTRTEMIHAWRTEAYFVHRTDSDEPANAEAGSSSFVPQHITYMAQPPTNPSGESSEAMADDENPKTFTEEHAAPTGPLPGTGKPLNSQARYNGLVRQLRAWAQEREHLTHAPTHEEALDIALGIVRTNNSLASQAPRLASASHRRTAAGERGPDLECERRRRVRGLNEELSKYYVLPEGEEKWTCRGLLSRMLWDVNHDPEA